MQSAAACVEPTLVRKYQLTVSALRATQFSLLYFGVTSRLTLPSAS